MSKTYILLVFGLLLYNGLTYSQSPLGHWKIFDESDGEAKSIVEIYEKDGLLAAKVVEFFPSATVTHCTKCKDEFKGKSLLEMDIISGMVEYEDKWDDGKILDPERGKEYSCQISFKDSNTLKVRGYIVKPLFGKTHLWYRAE